MVKKNTIYLAQIGHGPDAEILDVDVLALPYDRFNAENPLIILGSVILPSVSKKKLPDFSNVIINGDCLYTNNYIISSDSVLPRGISTLYCEYGIGDLGCLVGVLPDSVRCVRTRSAILNKVKNNTKAQKNRKPEDIAALQAAKQFVERYPNVIVSDGSQTLSEILDMVSVAEEKANNNSIRKRTVSPTCTVSVAVKTAQWLSNDELADACRAASPELKNISDDVLRRLLRMARSNKGMLNLQVAKMKRAEDGVEVNCTHRDCVALVVEFVENQLAEQRERNAETTKASAPKAKKAEPKSDNVASVQPVEPGEKTYLIGDKSAPMVKIAKYIPKKLWRTIRSVDCFDRVLGMLREIDGVNIWPTETDGDRVFYVSDADKAEATDNLRFKSQYCLTQRPSPENNKVRLIWYTADNMFVCVRLFKDHIKTSDKYKECVRGGCRDDFANIDMDKCYLVSDLIDQLTNSRDKAQDAKPVDTEIAETVVVDQIPVVEVAEPVGAVVEPVVEPAAQPVAEPVVEPVVEPVAAPVARKRRQRIKKVEKIMLPQPDESEKLHDTEPLKRRGRLRKAPLVAPVEMPAVTQTPVANGPDCKISKEPDWVDLYSMGTHIVETMTSIDVQCRELLTQIAQQWWDADKQLQMTTQLQDLLRRKKAYDESLAKLHRINSELQELRNSLDLGR